jgi:Uma2 family endonuclease
MNAVALVSVEDYLRITEKPNREYRDGQVILKATPTKLHSLIQFMLQMLLQAQDVQPFPELTIRISPTKFLIPDVAVADDFEGPYPTHSVVLCCEILSPEDRLGATFSKCEDYHAWGVPFCWVVDPVKRTAWEYHSGSEPERVSESLLAGTLKVPLSSLFAAIKPGDES